MLNAQTIKLILKGIISWIMSQTPDQKARSERVYDFYNYTNQYNARLSIVLETKVTRLACILEKTCLYNKYA